MKMLDKAPDYGTVEYTGNEGLGPGDLGAPQLRLLEGQSEACKEGLPGYVEGARAGTFMRTDTNLVFGREVLVANLCSFVRFDVVEMSDPDDMGERLGTFHSQNRQLAYQLRNRGKPFSDGRLSRRVDTVHVHTLFAPGKDGELDLETPLTMFLQRTRVQASMQWLRYLIGPQRRHEVRAASIWKLSPQTHTKDKNSWYSPTAEWIGWSPREVVEAVQPVVKALVEQERQLLANPAGQDVLPAKQPKRPPPASTDYQGEQPFDAPAAPPAGDGGVEIPY